MRLIILAVLLAWSSAAKLDRAYLPPNYAQTSGGSGSILQTPFAGPPSTVQIGGQSDDGFRTHDIIAQDANEYVQDQNGFASNGGGFIQNQSKKINNGINYFESRPERPRSALERNAAILRQSNENDGEIYSYAYETENGIYAEETGVATNGVEAQGGYSYTGDDGRVYSVRYTAGQNGFIAQGEHLPTSPPIPEEILLALEQNARDEAAGIYDDGSYNEGKYSSGDELSQVSNFGNNIRENNHNEINYNENNDDSIVVNSALNFEGSSNQRPNIQGSTRLDNEDPRLRTQSIGSNGLNRAYLPPTLNQRNLGDNSSSGRFGSRNPQPSYSSRTGYNY